MAWFRFTDNGGHAEDAALLSQVAVGDASACRLLSQRHLTRVVAFARRMLNDPMEAEDVVQEAFLKLWRIAPQWQSEARLDTWFYQVIHNLCMDRLRKHRESLPGELPEICDDRPTPLEQRYREQVAQTVEKALATLPTRQKAAIVLVHYQEMSGQEAADILSISVDALESLLSRGRKRLRQQLSSHKLALLEGEE